MNTPNHRAPHQPQGYPTQQYAPYRPLTPARRPMSVGRVLAIAAGVLLALLLLASLAGGGGSSPDGDGYGEQSGTGGEPSSECYDGGCMTTDGNGGIIVSGTDGSSYSTSSPTVSRCSSTRPRCR